MATTAELMRICAPLYPSIALESAANFGLFLFFSYLSILISTKQQVKTPARAICRMLWSSLKEWAEDTWRVLRRWPHMHEMELGQRFRYCRRLNATICRLSAGIALITITRWFHINNVNGFRYLGYALTCPLMQAELVLLIAPHIPCYRLLAVFSCLITFGMLLTGYVASQFEGPMWKNDFETFYDEALEGNLDSLTTKGWWLMPSTVILCFLSFVQIPILGLVYYCSGGSKNEDLPKGYPKLLMITSLSWLGFPVWWYLSYEGASIITESRWNAVGFVCLNMTSKGGFTLQMLSMVKAWKRQQAQKPKPPAPPVSADAVPKLELPMGAVPKGRRGSNATLPDLDTPAVRETRVVRNAKRNQTGQSLQWFVDAMKKWEPEDANPATSTAQEADRGPQGEIETVVVTDPRQLDDEQLVRELGKRLAAHGACGKGTPRTSLNASIRKACTKILEADESDDDE
ncbi:unnamed protein product [Prorocentrum cordatum]|uniref:Glycerophosphocholine acyltransferase 1 n=1 Tax=Prorocentrum cordatum TaxID=2364126 RepID=A0ABN9VBZ5_9DINO|nr:unnamed protein product [Polarella glacialis]